MPALSEYSLSGKVAILHTAGGDHAPYLAQALAEAGAVVFTVARRQHLLDPVLEALSQYPGGHGGAVADIGGKGSVDLARAIASYDLLGRPVDILVNDVRSVLARPYNEITVQEWDEIQSRNVRATFLLCQEVGQRMQVQQYGRIVNLVSILAERGMINGSAFAASQAAVLSLTRSLAVELGQSNIRVNALGSGWYTSEDIPLEVQQEELLVRYTPLRRKGHPREIGPLLVYLCSEACDYVTGQPVYVDGGLNAHP
jgi:NAD(P)-dependent dehydrogenase (short-subunit alcohol dehydrogenase family)